MAKPQQPWNSNWSRESLTCKKGTSGDGQAMANWHNWNLARLPSRAPTFRHGQIASQLQASTYGPETRQMAIRRMPALNREYS